MAVNFRKFLRQGRIVQNTPRQLAAQDSQASSCQDINPRSADKVGRFKPKKAFQVGNFKDLPNQYFSDENFLGLILTQEK
jgi:hypothetical protein